MRLTFDQKLVANYTSASQRVRVMTESWVDKFAFCPNCGNFEIDKHPNNQPVADFYCKSCKEDFELKSKKNALGKKIVDGAYRTMIERLTSRNNPNFFLMTYNLEDLSVINFLVIPKHFFIPEFIEQRKPLAETARRAGWVGCNILLNHIPSTGKIFLVRDRQVEPKRRVLAQWSKTLFLREEEEITAKGWLLDVMRCIEKIGKHDFSLADVYTFESNLSALHPSNKHIKDKIRQQLQILRDKGYMEFISRGRYRLT